MREQDKSKVRETSKKVRLVILSGMIEIIDVHTHLGPYHHKEGADKSVPLTRHQYHEYSADNLTCLMAESDIKKSVVFSFPWVNEPSKKENVAKYQQETDHLLGVAQRFPQLIPMPIFDPTDPKNVRFYERLFTGDIKSRINHTNLVHIPGFKIYPPAMSAPWFPLTSLKDSGMLTTAQKLGHTINIHTDGRRMKESLELIAFAESYKGNVIFPHAFRFSKKLIKMAGKLKNVYFDCTPLVLLVSNPSFWVSDDCLLSSESYKKPRETYDQVVKMLIEFSRGKVIGPGTDNPYCYSYRDEIAFFRGLPPETQDLLQTNARRLFCRKT